MASIQEHCADCIHELGDGFPQVHEWLDELFDNLGPDHRDVRHNQNGVDKVRQMWGDRAARAAEIHIVKDEGRVPEVDSSFMLRIALKSGVSEAFAKEYSR